MILGGTDEAVATRILQRECRAILAEAMPAIVKEAAGQPIPELSLLAGGVYFKSGNVCFTEKSSPTAMWVNFNVPSIRFFERLAKALEREAYAEIMKIIKKLK